MDSEQVEQLEEALELARDNNKILHKMQRSLMWSKVFKVIYIVIILGVTFGAYYFVQPYLEQVLGTYQSLLGGVEEVNQAGNALPDIGKLFEGFGN